MRSVVVASGKGGTGKTTVSALFAHMAARSHKVAVADADVEASNLPLALHIGVSECETFEGGYCAAIDTDKCTMCGRCVEACVSDTILERGGVLVVDDLACEGCGACAAVCPAGAIQMVPQTIGSACTGMSAVGPIAHGQLGPGEDLSGRLVTEVRRRGAEIVLASDADLLIIDGPPGVACPTIAAIANTDLLVAVTEPTLSGAYDLRRLAELAHNLRLPVTVILNKSDLSDPGAEEVRRLCAEKRLPLIAEVPFDPEVANALDRLATEPAARALDRWSVGLRMLGCAWNVIELALGLNAPIPGAIVSDDMAQRRRPEWVARAMGTTFDD